MRRGDGDELVNLVVRWRRKASRDGTFPGQVRACNKTTHAVGYKIDLRDWHSIGISQAIDVGVELTSQLFDRYISVGTIVKKEDRRTIRLQERRQLSKGSY
jgi:hypothetical protein